MDRLEIMVMRRAGPGSWLLPAWQAMLDSRGAGPRDVARSLERYHARLRHVAAGETWLVFADADRMAWWLLEWS